MRALTCLNWARERMAGWPVANESVGFRAEFKHCGREIGRRRTPLVHSRRDKVRSSLEGEMFSWATNLGSMRCWFQEP